MANRGLSSMLTNNCYNWLPAPLYWHSVGVWPIIFVEKSVLVKHTNEHPQRVILDTYCHPGGVQRHGILKEPTVKCVNNRLVPHKHILKSSVILFIFSFLPPPHPGCLQQWWSSKGPVTFNGKISEDGRKTPEWATSLEEGGRNHPLHILQRNKQ